MFATNSRAPSAPRRSSFQFAGLRSFSQLNEIHSSAGSLHDFVQQSTTARRFVVHKLCPVGDVVEQQSGWKLRATYGFVLAISGIAVALRLGSVPR